MKLAQNTSLVMRVPSSNRTHRSGVVGCCMEQYNPLALKTASHSGQFKPAGLALDITKEQIRKMFNNVELSVSSYDTAWVAMVPSPNSPKSPCFPECVNWLMDNQINDGSWGFLHNNNPLLIKDALSSTLACIVALKQWNVGEEQINKGLSFIESNFSSATDKNQPSPSGFDIIFPHMLQHAIDMNINLPLKQSDLSVMLHERQLILNRSDSKKRKAYLAYISEGLGEFYDWNMVKKYQMKNGSLFNSPSASAAAIIHHQNTGCLNYLRSLLNEFGNAAPTVYPLDLYVRLSMVDTLERLDITRHFQEEIQNVLDETYRCWVEKDEQIFMDVVTCALAFRLLRTNGYEVSSDSLTEVTKEDVSHDQESFKDVYESLEMYKASLIQYQEELSFNEQKLRLANLKRKLSSASNNKLSSLIHTEVNNALTFPFNARFEGLYLKKNIESYNADYTRILKTTYCSSNISNNDYLLLAVEDFSESQSIFRAELEYLERWVVEHRIDKLKFARQKQIYALFTASSTFSSPELSDARITWAKACVLVTVIDDFFDIKGSPEELDNLIQCFEKWNVNIETDCCTEEVRILFVALKDAVLWVGDKGFKWQERDITSHLIETWLDMMKSMLEEAIWARDDVVPTIDEYIKVSLVSFGLGPPVLQSLYFAGPKLLEEIVRSSEYNSLFELLSTHGRLLNDTRTIYKEISNGRLNAVTLHKNYGKNAIEDAEVIDEVNLWSKDQERKLLKLVLTEKGSIVPRACKDPFWKMCNIVNTFYSNDDGYTGHAILDVAHEIINEPLRIPLVSAYE